MNRRRAVVFVALLAAPLAGVAVACSFPDVAFVDVAATNETGSPDSPDPTRADDSGFRADGDPTSIFDGALGDGGLVRGDEEAIIVDPDVCKTRPLCDCDQDTYFDDDCADAAVKNGDGGLLEAGKAGDCDDLDKVRNPGADFRADTPPASHTGDWNCDTNVEKRPPANLKCLEPSAVVAGALGYRCNGGGQGFLGDVACGASAPLWICPEGAAATKAECNAKPYFVEGSSQQATATMQCR